MSSPFASLLALALCLALLGHRGAAAHGGDRVVHPTTSPGFSTAANTSIPEIVARVCRRSNRKALCLASLQAVPDVGSVPDTGVLAIAALRFAATNASETSSFIQGLLNDTTIEPAIQQGLSDCADRYLDAVDQIDDSIAALTVKAYPDVREWVKAAIADAEACEAGFSQLATEQRILSHKNLVFRQLCNIALGIVKNLKD
ncbi:hypothetical protein BT93_H0626 [Corymbia citriodora subsp. variegata]|nr:hypothetical protein BT93_H0626 [Corymbia citriodora subsp. variegata]